MTDSMDRIAMFFHEDENYGRARDLREALDQFETRMPERILNRISAKLQLTSEITPSGWGPFERIPRQGRRAIGADGLGWARRDPQTEGFSDWVGLGWYADELFKLQGRPQNPCRWIGWRNNGIQHGSPAELHIFEKTKDNLGTLIEILLYADSTFDEPRHGDGWPYFCSVPAPEPADLMRIDTDEFAETLSQLLPEIRRAVERIGRYR